MKRKEVSLNYLSTMMDLYVEAKQPTELQLTKFLRKRNVSNALGTMLIKKGYLKRVEYKTYQWVAKRPTLLMADEVRKSISDQSIKYNEAARTNKVADPKTTKSVRVYKSRKPQSIETKFFFGLFTLNSKINY